MGWGNGARRQQCRSALSQSFARFSASLDDKVELKNGINKVRDNYNFDVIPTLVYDPTSQEDLVADINASTESEVAVAIAFSDSLRSLDDVTDTLCQSLKGLFLYSTINFNQAALRQFIHRCPNLKSLTLAFVDDFDSCFLQSLFADGLLPALEFLEVSNAKNDAIAAMHTAPNLRKIVFRWPDPSISDVGFQRLVENGGGKNLVAISAGSLTKDLSKTLSKNRLKAILPKFVSGEAFEHDLEHISMGAKYIRSDVQPKKPKAIQSGIQSKKPKTVQRDVKPKKSAKQKSLPFALVPVESMSYQQLRDAVKNRGLVMPHPASTDKLRAVLIGAGFTMEEEMAIQSREHVEHLSRDVLPRLKTVAQELRASIKKVQYALPHKLYPDLTKANMVSIMRNKYGGVPSKYNRAEVAAALHEKRHQGGGDQHARLVFFQQELNHTKQELANVKGKIEFFQAKADKYFNQKKKKAGKSSVGAKRPLAHVN